MTTIYFDNNATTKIDPLVLKEMMPFLTDYYGNPSSMHKFGGQVSSDIAKARHRLASLLNAQPDEIIFTAGGTESDNTAIYSALEAQPGKKHIITTRVEHPAILNVCRHLEQRGYDVTYLNVDTKGQLDLDELRNALRPDTALVTIMYANSETGVIFPMHEIAKIVKDRGIMLHTDAVQAVGKIELNLETLPVDYLSLSGHKIHGPKGIGALYVRKGASFRPHMRGGHQEEGRRAGTENTAAIVGLGKAAELAQLNMEIENTGVKHMRDVLEKGLLETIPDSIINGDTESRLPNTTNISFKHVEGEAILLMMDGHDIAASSGSACTSGSLEPSHVLRAMGVPFTFAHGSIRFSLSRFNDDKEVKVVLKELPAIIKRLREISPYKNDDGAEAPTRPCSC
ncbi:cysteine desulfurase NifS [Halodesulfovibrio sp.]|uniref:cysteine desulfurase NifS n=1 Tax=Halodesulfovibrio sp. TaxID=1912772 RepID=UPI0025E04CB0|nr:cysteine desulfurase NifS [Halodesulfovibrio sp.]MCT4535951.1 cysteine desulfurase NifS [Halodesulfovibrio sp.]MCT4628167.1 cysteine desulfurase NifS [Halodesulfovibrio sp.]